MHAEGYKDMCAALEEKGSHLQPQWAGCLTIDEMNVKGKLIQDKAGKVLGWAVMNDQLATLEDLFKDCSGADYRKPHCRQLMCCIIVALSGFEI